MEIVMSVLGIFVLLSWLYLIMMVVLARQGGARDERSRFLGWLANRDYQIWTDYLEFERAKTDAWREDYERK